MFLRRDKEKMFTQKDEEKYNKDFEELGKLLERDRWLTLVQLGLAAAMGVFLVTYFIQGTPVWGALAVIAFAMWVVLYPIHRRVVESVRKLTASLPEKEMSK